MDYSELKVIGTQEIQVKPLAFQSYLQDIRERAWPRKRTSLEITTNNMW